jgi:hypothetical protein
MFSIHFLKLVMQMHDPALAKVKPVAINGKPSSTCAELHPITKNPISISIAPKTQVSNAVHALCIFQKVI